jgi:predicted MFS family arabinose efflux permease
MDKTLRAMLPLFAAVFIDLFSFGLMYPVIVALFHLPAIEQAYAAGIRGLYLSAAFSLFPLGMFFGASLLGDLSDAIGRKHTLLICMTGLAAAYALMTIGVQSRNLLWFLAGRLLSGLMAGTSPIAQAAMMDHSTEKERGRNMAHVVLVNCVALVSGPAAGGLLGHLDFRAPLLFALALCLMAFAWIAIGAPIDRPVGKRLSLSWRRPFEIAAKAWQHSLIRGLASSFFLFQLGFGVYYVYIMVYMVRAFHLAPARLGLFSAVLGVGFVIGSIFGYGRAKQWLKRDSKVAQSGLWSCGWLIVASALPLGEAAEWLLALIASIANLLAFVGLLTLISSAASADEQGWALGIGSAMTALAFFIGGLLAAILHVVPLPLLLAMGGLIVLAAVAPLRGPARALNLKKATTAADPNAAVC